jgi:hypothetical protein
MIQHRSWTGSLGNLLKRISEKALNLFRADITETKWGHRVMDQIFREGRFAPGDSHEPGNGGPKE